MSDLVFSDHVVFRLDGNSKRKKGWTHQRDDIIAAGFLRARLIRL
jgi:hypothetical protein